MKIDVIEKLKGKLIVSCQAYEDNPLYGVDHMVTLAKCVIKGGAGGLRICWPKAIAEVRKITDLPIIGINKIVDEDNFDMYAQVFITPTYESAVAIIEAGCDIVAMDGTLRNRSYDDLEAIVKKLKLNYPHIPLMADIATMEEGKACEAMGFDILSSTLSGYTQETKDLDPLKPDFKFVRDLVEKTNCVVNGEGRIWNLDQYYEVMNCGADMVTIGSAITNPMKITSYFETALKHYKEVNSL